jgi:hypothetical protein
MCVAIQNDLVYARFEAIDRVGIGRARRHVENKAIDRAVPDELEVITGETIIAFAANETRPAFVYGDRIVASAAV